MVVIAEEKESYHIHVRGSLDPEAVSSSAQLGRSTVLGDLPREKEMSSSKESLRYVSGSMAKTSYQFEGVSSEVDHMLPLSGEKVLGTHDSLWTSKSTIGVN